MDRALDDIENGRLHEFWRLQMLDELQRRFAALDWQPSLDPSGRRRHALRELIAELETIEAGANRELRENGRSEDRHETRHEPSRKPPPEERRPRPRGMHVVGGIGDRLAELLARVGHGLRRVSRREEARCETS